jgi:hypothetical protein
MFFNEFPSIVRIFLTEFSWISAFFINVSPTAYIGTLIYRQSGWLCTGWGKIAQSFNFKYLYKSDCKSIELLWAFKGYHIIYNPLQFAEFTVTLVKIFKV